MVSPGQQGMGGYSLGKVGESTRQLVTVTLIFIPFSLPFVPNDQTEKKGGRRGTPKCSHM